MDDVEDPRSDRRFLTPTTAGGGGGGALMLPTGGRGLKYSGLSMHILFVISRYCPGWSSGNASSGTVSVSSMLSSETGHAQGENMEVNMSQH